MFINTEMGIQKLVACVTSHKTVSVESMAL